MIRRGEGGEEWRGKKDTGYLYKALMVARVALSLASPDTFSIRSAAFLKRFLERSLGNRFDLNARQLQLRTQPYYTQ